MPSSNPFDSTNLETLLPPGIDPWHTGSGTITYSFLSTVPTYYEVGFGSAEIAEFTVASGSDVSLSPTQESLVQRAIDAFNEVADVRLVETSGIGDITFGAFDFPDQSLFGFAYFPGAGEIFGDLWLNNAMSIVASPTLGDEGWVTILHELGHAIGLDHPFDGTVLDASLDSSQYTVMSYDPHPDQAFTFDSVWPLTPMLYDIAALQELYGANTSTRTGDTTYGLDATGSTYGIADGGSLIAAIWDAGGRDTIDASNQSGDVRIDLRAGHFSSIGAIADNIAIAFGAVIENATGGSGKDTLTGNGAWNRIVGNDGADRIDGYDGFDTLSGGTGNDKLFGGNGNDRLEGGTGTDELFGGKGSDRLLGGDGADKLSGHDGNDTLAGGRGNDVLAGGSGADVFVLNTTPHATSNVDRITDFAVGLDRLQLDDAAFAALGSPGALPATAFHGGTKAADASDRLVYDAATGALYYDADGTGAIAQVKVAILSAGLALTAADVQII